MCAAKRERADGHALLPLSPASAGQPADMMRHDVHLALIPSHVPIDNNVNCGCQLCRSRTSARPVWLALPPQGPRKEAL